MGMVGYVMSDNDPRSGYVCLAYEPAGGVG
jgi:hypothetical protein